MEDLYIGGRWRDACDGQTVQVGNPADGSVLAEVSYGGAAEAIAAAEAAAGAFERWSGSPGRDRSALLRSVAEMLSERAARVGLLLSRETGKRLPEGIAEVEFAAQYFHWFAEELRRPTGHLLASEFPNRRQFTSRQAIGVAACLTPWNFPVSIQARKLAAALAAGCTVVSRASELAPLSVIELFRCLDEAGFPAGVANLVLGRAAEQTEALLAHRAVRVVSFTGSTEVGRHIMALAAHRVVRPLLELGGDAPFVVLDDADLDAAVDGAMLAKFRNNGQSCIAANRFLVQSGIYDEFCQQLASRVGAMVVGRPDGEPVPDLGPLISQQRVDAVQGIVTGAEAAGAQRITSLPEVPDKGCYLAPALYDNVPADSALARAEVFGPVAGVFRFETDEEAVALANDTEMGLAAYVYTRSAQRGWRFAGDLEAGIIGCNTPLPSVAHAPMGGLKQSGLGREGGTAGLDEFRETRFASWQL